MKMQKLKSFTVAIAATAILIAAHSAQASISLFTINQSVTQGGSSSDFSALNFVVGPGVTITVDPGASGIYLDLALGGASFSVISTATTTADSYLRTYNAGTTLDSSNFKASPGVNSWAYSLYSNIAGGPWTSSFTDGYVGFKTPSAGYGYIRLDWTYAGGVGTMTLKDGAYETISNQGIQIAGMSAVPEPSTYIAAALLLLPFGVHTARHLRKHKQVS